MKKTETITSLNGRIATLSDSDLILRRNKELETESKSLKDRISQTESAADDRIALIQKECRQTSNAVDEYKQILDKREADLRKKEEDIEGFIFQKASEKAAEAKRVLEAGYEQKKKEVVRDFEIKKAALLGFFIFSSLYGILITLLQLGRSKRFTGDMVGAGGAVFGAIKWYVLLIWNWSGGVGKWASRAIENPTWHKVVYVTVVILLLVIFIGGIAFRVGYGLYRLVPFLYRKFGDVVTLSFFLVSLSVIAWIVDIFDKHIPINVVLMYVVCLIGYFGIRWFISRKNIGNPFRRGYKDEW